MALVWLVPAVAMNLLARALDWVEAVGSRARVPPATFRVAPPSAPTGAAARLSVLTWAAALARSTDTGLTVKELAAVKLLGVAALVLVSCREPPDTVAVRGLAAIT